MLDAKVSIKLLFYISISLYKVIIHKKGILSDVTLDGKALKNWTSCITDNFIPNYRQKLENPSFLLKYTTTNNLLKNRIQKYII
jgi:hypothetical protein